ncbi:MAG: hypothetical protein CMB11_10060 [Euryarchaeota archaeon]|nr:hypothetical protein [Euryarchaeota archaeon]
MEINARGPSVVLAEADRVSPPNHLGDAVPHPRLYDLQGRQGVGGFGQEPIERLDQQQGERVFSVPQAEGCHFGPGHVVLGLRRRCHVHNSRCCLIGASVAILQGTLTPRRAMEGGVQAVSPTHRLDVRGYRCPIPVGETRQALKDLDQGHVLEVRFDDPEALEDLPPMLARHGHRMLTVEEVAGDWRMCIEVIG